MQDMFHNGIKVFFFSFLLRKTLARSFSIQGIGVHTGEVINVTCFPVHQKAGIGFVRSDLKSPFDKFVLKADARIVHDTFFCTTLEKDGVSVSTVEHFMAALWATGVTDALIHVDGPEMPILDGSATPWIQEIQGASVKTFQAEGIDDGPLIVMQKLRVEDRERFLEISPFDGLKVDISVKLDNDMVQNFCYDAEKDSFVENIASARTFSFHKNIEAMRARGLIKGGSLDNALVIKNGRPVNKGGWRSENECARHKILDLLGDWSLLGRKIKGTVIGVGSGHGMNIDLLKKMIEMDEIVCTFTAAEES